MKPAAWHNQYLEEAVLLISEYCEAMSKAGKSDTTEQKVSWNEWPVFSPSYYWRRKQWMIADLQETCTEQIHSHGRGGWCNEGCQGGDTTSPFLNPGILTKGQRVLSNTLYIRTNHQQAHTQQQANHQATWVSMYIRHSGPQFHFRNM